MKTEQEIFWSGDFGNEYVDRNKGDKWIAGYISHFNDVLRRVPQVNSIVEFGCNRGMNLQALHHLLPEAELHGIEINKKACEIANSLSYATAINDSILEIELERKYDLTLIKGVMIHINPDYLNDVYDRLYRFSNKYICIAEYYNPTPVALPYRGNSEKLFKRDFAGEIMDKYPDLKLIDYGFTYHRDPKYKHDDLNWFLLEK